MHILKIFRLTAFLLVAALVVTGAAIAAPTFKVKPLYTADGPDKKSTEIIVKFKETLSSERVDQINGRMGGTALSKSKRGKFMRVKIPAKKSVEEMVARYSREAGVVFAEPNYIAYAMLTPNDARYPDQWHFQNDEYGGVNMEAAWEISRGAPDVIVAVVDSGVAYESHEEYIDNIGRRRDYWQTYAVAPDLADTLFVDGYDFVNNDSHPNDDEGHGTHVAGTIAQSTNNGIGVAGIAHLSAIMPIKVLDRYGSGSYTDIADGIYFAADNGADVINMSLGGSYGSIILEEALAYAYAKGVTIICASGNNGSDTTISYPAAYDDYCIAVGATRYDEQVAYYSNKGPSLDVTAPGGDTSVDQNGDGHIDGVLQQTFSYTPTNFDYWYYQGTSMATPHVSGIAALLIASGAAATPDEIREILQSTAKDRGAPGYDTEYGWGIVDAYAALSSVAVPNTPPVAVIDKPEPEPKTGTEDIPLEFDGSGSYDPDEGSLTYRWDFGDNSVGSGATPSHTYLQGGEFIVTLIVNDGKDDSEPDTLTVDITEVNDRPIADAGGPYDSFEGQTVTFDGTRSFDPEGNPVTYAWNFGDGSEGTGAQPSHVYASSGTYPVTLTVNDGDLDSLPDSTTANIGEINDPPVADAGGPYAGDEDADIAFDGSASADPEGSALTYQWDFGDGATATEMKPSHSYTAGGTYTVRLVVNDGTQDSTADETTATIEEINDPPVANVGGPYSGTEDIPVDFDGTGSSDPEHAPLTYQWSFGDGETGTGATPSHTYLAGGTYVVGLIVHDGTVASTASSISINITEMNDPPVADVGGPYSGTEDIPINFDGSGSSDIEDDPLTYQWDFGDGTTGNGPTPSHTYLAGGTYTVQLIVNDGTDDSTPSSTTFNVTEVNDAPVAVAGPDINASLDQTVSFDGSASYDPENQSLTYLWDFDDGNTATGAQVNHSYAATGDYQVILTVTDSQGSSDTDQLQVSVTENLAQELSVSNIDMGISSRLYFRYYIYSATATITIVDAAGNPVPGATVTGHWSGATADTDILTTNSSGQITAESNRVINPPAGSTFTFTIDQVALTDWTYAPADNIETSDSISLP